MKLTNNFYLKEFESKDGADTPEDVLHNLRLLTEQLQILRDYTGLPIKINSGYRSPYYNDVVLPSRGIKASKNSQHKLGKAADIVIVGLKPFETYALIEYLIDKGVLKIGGLGSYKTFTHLDIRTKKARW